MRTFWAYSISLLWHVAIYAVLASCMPTQAWIQLENRLARGNPVIVQVSFATATEEPIEAVKIEPTPEPVAHEPPPALEPTEVRPREHALPPIDVVPAGKLPPRKTTVRDAEPTEVVEATTAAAAEAKSERNKPSETKPTPKETKTKRPPRQVQPARVIAQQQAVALPFQTATAVGADVDEMPRKLANNPAPIYPAGALLADEEGRVMLRVVIRADGQVALAEVATSSGSGALDASAIAAVRRWRFTPARRAGMAVVHEVLVPVLFSIRR